MYKVPTSENLSDHQTRWALKSLAQWSQIQASARRVEKWKEEQWKLLTTKLRKHLERAKEQEMPQL